MPREPLAGLLEIALRELLREKGTFAYYEDAEEFLRHGEYRLCLETILDRVIHDSETE
jgi:hypothetical protein